MSGKRSKKKSRRGRWKILAVLAVVVLPVLVLSIAFPLQNMVTRGNVHVSADEVKEVVLDTPSFGNTLLAWLWNRNRTISDYGFIDSVHAEITSRNSLEIKVTERRMIGAVEDNGSFVFLSSGGTVEAISTSKPEGDNIPIVTGLDLKASAVVGSVLPIQGTKPFILLDSLKSITTQYDITPERIIFGENNSMSLIYGDVTVLIGDGTNLELRVAELAGILEEMDSSYSGTLHLENFERSGNPVVFDKN